MLKESLYCILVNRNSSADTIACIDSLWRAGVAAGRIVVVDNGSQDDSPRRLAEVFGKRIVLLENVRNLGFAAAVNQAIAYALSQDAGSVFLLNNDTLVAANLFDELDLAAARHPDIAVLAPLILVASEPERIWCVGDRLIPGTLFTRSLFGGSRDTGRLPDLVPVDFVTGCGMWIKRSVFTRIGLFDTQYFMYAEDVDFCWRARRAGFRLACAPRAKLWHKVSGTAGRDPSASAYYKIGGQARFYRRNSGGIQLIVMWWLSLLRVGSIAMRALMHRSVRLATLSLRAWADGWSDSLTARANSW